MFFKDRDKYAHQCELRCVIRDESERFTTHSQSKTIHLDGLSFFNSDDSDDKNATGMDFIYSDKNNEIFAEVIMRNERDI
jgi:hypothetical protein